MKNKKIFLRALLALLIFSFSFVLFEFSGSYILYSEETKFEGFKGYVLEWSASKQTWVPSVGAHIRCIASDGTYSTSTTVSGGYYEIKLPKHEAGDYVVEGEKWIDGEYWCHSETKYHPDSLETVTHNFKLDCTY